MAIEKNNFKASRVDSEFSPHSRETMSSDDDDLQPNNSAVESDDDDEFDDADSGAGSDDFDLLELGETGAEFCQIGNQTCSIPLELYDLPGLDDILSVDVWNDCLSEEERFELAKYLPDMDQEAFVRTLTDLFTGCNLHFGSPIKKLFEMLKGGLCEPRVALYREGLNFFQKRQHYNLLRKHQNNMVVNLCQIRDAWLNCRGYSIEEKLRVLNIMRSSLMSEKTDDLAVISSAEDSDEGLWNRKSKDRKNVQKMGLHFPYMAGSGLQSVGVGLEKYGKQNPKSILGLPGLMSSTAKDPAGYLPLGYHGLDMNSGLNGSTSMFPQQKSVAYDSGLLMRMRDRLGSDGADEMAYELGVQHERNALRSKMIDKPGAMRTGKRRDILRDDEIDNDNILNLHAYSRNRSSDRKMLTAKSTRGSYDISRKAKYIENGQQFVDDQIKPRLRGSQLPHKGSLVDSFDHDGYFGNSKTLGDESAMDPSFQYDDWNSRSKRWKAGRESPDLSYAAYRSSSPHVSDRHMPTGSRKKSLNEKVRGAFVQNGGQDTLASRGKRMLHRNEETESDSSEQMNDDEDANTLLQRKFAYSVNDDSRMTVLKSRLEPKEAKLVKKDFKGHGKAKSNRMGYFGENSLSAIDKFLSKDKQKGKIRQGGSLHDFADKHVEESYPSSPEKPYDDDVDWRGNFRLGKNGRITQEPIRRLAMPSLNAYGYEPKKKGKGRNEFDHSTLRSKYLNDYIGGEEDSPEASILGDDNGVAKGRFRKKGKKIDGYKDDKYGKSEAQFLACNSVSKKWKVKDVAADLDGREGDANHLSNFHPDNSAPMKRRSKRKMDIETVSSDVDISALPIVDLGTADTELEAKPQKKSFTPITPTVHTGFSFSIIHLLSAVRMAMITPPTEDSLEVGKSTEDQNKEHEIAANGVSSDEKITTNSEPASKVNTPLTVQEIVQRVRSNPGDPCILETQEPLQDLVRGVLKIFSSKTAPLGAKGWKALAVYEKSTRGWSWTGPVSPSSPDHDSIEEVTSPEAWGLPHKMLVKLVDTFANWLKCGQETLQQIGSLPPPPLELMQVNLDEKERFRDLRAQKSLNTISPSSEEVRSYFRKEEVLRYSIPDRAFSYTAADGKKSIVAPLRRCGGKPTSKARDHFMLKRDRPPHVTILCLVRDAAARLPGNIGTRADVCTLIRDSQYIVEDVSDAQINQVVSGALDRLHYERDPCVQFDGERKLWVYLHRDREEEDFEDDGTSSTKKWKRQKKDPADQSDQGAVTVSVNETGDQNGLDLCSDLNAEPSGIEDDKGGELVADDVRLDVEDNVDANLETEQGDALQDNSMDWETVGVITTDENKLLCQENSANEDFGDESFGREKSIELPGENLL